MFQCGDHAAQSFRQKTVYQTLNDLALINTNIETLHTLEYNLTSFLKVDCLHRYSAATQHSTCVNAANTATKHQNIIGWENFMRGFIYKKWAATQQHTKHKRHRSIQSWSHQLTRQIVELLLAIWQDRNQAIQQKSIAESRFKAREAIVKKVNDIYKNPPKLATRYPAITQIPICMVCVKNTKTEILPNFEISKFL
jgi:hypothetical protein